MQSWGHLLTTWAFFCALSDARIIRTKHPLQSAFVVCLLEHTVPPEIPIAKVRHFIDVAFEMYAGATGLQYKQMCNPKRYVRMFISFEAFDHYYRNSTKCSFEPTNVAHAYNIPLFDMHINSEKILRLLNHSNSGSGAYVGGNGSRDNSSDSDGDGNDSDGDDGSRYGNRGSGTESSLGSKYRTNSNNSVTIDSIPTTAAADNATATVTIVPNATLDIKVSKAILTKRLNRLLLTVILHEFGHSMGLSHNIDTDSIMNVNPFKTFGPNRTDVHKLRRIWLRIKRRGSW